jgi:hypothetical protein
MAACEFHMSPPDLGGRDAQVFGEGHQQRLVACNVVEYPREESRLGGGGANLACVEAGKGEETLEALAILGEVAKCLYRNGFCRLAARIWGRYFVQLFAFPKGISLSLK